MHVASQTYIDARRAQKTRHDLLSFDFNDSVQNNNIKTGINSSSQISFKASQSKDSYGNVY